MFPNSAKQPNIIITCRLRIYGKVANITIITIKDTCKRRTLKISRVVIYIRCYECGGVGSTGQINIGFKAGIADPVIRISRKLVKIRRRLNPPRLRLCSRAR